MDTEILQHPLTRGRDPDAPEMVSIHRKLIESKPLLRDVFQDWYTRLKIAVDSSPATGPIIELGCGASQLETVIPNVIKTDVTQTDNTTRVVNAENLPFDDNSVKALLMIGVLHHLPDPEVFFKEAHRVLNQGGRLVMIEPSDSPLHAMMTNICNPHEYYDNTVQNWKNSVNGRMSHANNAIPSVIFHRDVDLFRKKFPSLGVKSVQNHTFLSYYVTGGMSYPAFLPGWARPAVRAVEWLTRPLHRWLGTMMTIDLEKRSVAPEENDRVTESHS